MTKTDPPVGAGTDRGEAAGRPRPAVVAIPAYRPGKAASQAEEEHGITNAIKLASNENALPPVPAVLAAVREAAADVNRYADHRCTELRARLGDWLNLPPEQVTVGCGSVGLLQQILLTYVDPGEEVVYPWRSFEVYPVFTQLVGGRAVTTPLVDHASDLDAVAAAVTPATKVVLLASPNNPTGAGLHTDDIAALLSKVDNGTIVVVDEAYREFVDPSFGDPITLVANHPNLVVLRTFSKAHGLAALRIGYGVGHPDVIASIDKTMFPFAVNGLAQAGALAAIDAMDEINARVADIISERSRVTEALVADGVDVAPSQANFVWLPLGDETDQVYLAIEQAGVVPRPFSGEGIRVTIGTPEQNDRFLAAFRNAAGS